MKFKIIKKSKISRARIGILKTVHGEIETPAFVPVATQGTIKALDNEEVYKTGSQLIIANTFHLHLKPGEKIIKSSGGLHTYANWKIPIMTDSGGFQVFSLGFGKDLGVGKVVKFFPGDVERNINTGDQPVNAKITEDGVFFRSPLDGSELFLGPKESMKIQSDLGSDIIFTFDECTAPFSTKEYIRNAINRTHRWAKISIEKHDNKQAIFGIVQGSKFKDLRHESAKYINSLEFDGFGIGGDLGTTKTDITDILSWVHQDLDQTKPKHLLGVGYVEDMEMIVREGIDTFDCVVPTQYGRHGQAFTSSGKINLRGASFLKNKEPLDKKCSCYVCQNYKRNYLSHLFRAHEITALKLLSYHNMFFFNSAISIIRQKIKNGKI
jgi:queuine tRNA-ribosyltransferase/7-cyano-7-deazaguanine tRNA-ribosyltransferase